jgi:glycosyltransferase involved in cell wall biosynthesis
LKVAALIPAYQAAPTIEKVVTAFSAAAALCGQNVPVYVVDDGSTDDTGSLARHAGAYVLQHAKNRGKGAALITGFRTLERQGFDAAVTLDADAQHPVEEALRLAQLPLPQDCLVLGVRDLAGAGAPANSQFSNSLSNFFISRFAGIRLNDTQCGLRRYPLPQTLELGLRSPGYELEAEVILRAARARWSIQQTPVLVIYPPKEQRISHFHVVRDPARIVWRVLQTWLSSALR